MRNTWKIAKWEVFRNLTNKQFIIGLLITPLIMAVFGGLPALLERWNKPAEVTYYVIDHIEALPALESMLPDNIILEKFEDESMVAVAVQDKKANGYFTLSQKFLEKGELELIYNEHSNTGISALSQALTTILQQARLSRAEINREQLAFLTAPVQINQVPLKEDSEPKDLKLVVSVVFTILIFYLIIISGSMLMQSALQEKRDRMAEVVLSSIKPAQLMQGKILGHFFLGVIQLSFWLALGLPLAIYFLDFPVLEALQAVNVPLLLFFGLCGFLLFSALFVSMGATMEDLQSAGNSQGLVVMLPMLPILFIAPIVSNPDGTVAVFASLFPLTSPSIMMVRTGMTEVPLWQLFTSGALLLITTWLIVKAAAKIFRIGMLMYGKNATMGEIFKWLRYKEN